MLLTKNNDNTTICTYLMKRGTYEYYDPRAGVVFEASPCDNCGALAAHGDELTIEHIDGALHKALSAMYKVREWNESDFAEDGGEACERCL